MSQHSEFYIMARGTATTALSWPPKFSTPTHCGILGTKKKKKNKVGAIKIWNEWLIYATVAIFFRRGRRAKEQWYRIIIPALEPFSLNDDMPLGQYCPRQKMGVIIVWAR